MSWKKEIPYDHSSYDQLVFFIPLFRSEPGLTGLPDHLFNRFLRFVRIVSCMRILPGKFRRNIFQIRKIYIHKTVQHFQ